MFLRMQDQFQWRADLLLSGRLEDLASEFLFPCAFYIGQDMRMLLTAAQFVHVMGNFRYWRLVNGTRQHLAQVISVEVPRNRRFRVWVDFRDFAEDGRELRMMGTLHYCRQTDSGVQTEMVESWMCSADEFAEVPISRIT